MFQVAESQSTTTVFSPSFVAAAAAVKMDPDWQPAAGGAGGAGPGHGHGQQGGAAAADPAPVPQLPLAIGKKIAAADKIVKQVETKTHLTTFIGNVS